MIRNLIRYAALAAVVALGGCEKRLVTQNEVSGDTKRVLGTPSDAENLISSYYKRWSSGVYGSTTNLEGMANVMSLMNYSSLANNCQNARWPFGNVSNSNAPGNTCGGEQYRLYSILGEVTRVSSNLLVQMNDSGLTLNPTTATPLTDAKNLRARSFAEFLRGISLGYVALMYDSSSVVSPTMASADCVPDPNSNVCVGTLRPYTEVMDSAYAALQRSIDLANAPVITGTGGFPIPNGVGTWLPSPTTWSAAEFTKLIKSYRARFRANIARTPAQRADISAGGMVDWAKVVADAQGGITADHLITTSTTSGPGNSWRVQYMTFSTWHQMPGWIIGMADTSGSYANWIALPNGSKGAGNTGFFMVTPDLRFPQGATRALQQADHDKVSCQAASTPCKRYFTNRAAGNDDFTGASWGFSNYDFIRFYSWFKAGDGTAQNGNTPFFTLAELDMLQAEGLYRQGNFAGAAALVNKTRTAGMSGTPLVAKGGGLPAITVFNATAVVPGGNACVPKVPGFGTPAGDYTKVGCGNLWEALKYEKRIETAYTTYAPWFLDERGWGDLPKDTPLFWAVPYQELQSRGRPCSPCYGSGPGTGNAANSQAGASTYGW